MGLEDKVQGSNGKHEITAEVGFGEEKRVLPTVVRTTLVLSTMLCSEAGSLASTCRSGTSPSIPISLPTISRTETWQRIIFKGACDI